MRRIVNALGKLNRGKVAFLCATPVRDDVRRRSAAYQPAGSAYQNELTTIYPQISTANGTALALWQAYVAKNVCPT
jgi:hypothetical protein